MMDIAIGHIDDPLIAPSGMVYSLRGLRRLASVLCGIGVDDMRQKRRRSTAWKKEGAWTEQTPSGRKILMNC